MKIALLLDIDLIDILQQVSIKNINNRLSDTSLTDRTRNKRVLTDFGGLRRIEKDAQSAPQRILRDLGCSYNYNGKGIFFL